MRQGKPEQAIDAIVKISENNSDMPEWQNNDLQEMASKIMETAKTLLSTEELKFLKAKLRSSIPITEVVAQKTANLNYAPPALAA